MTRAGDPAPDLQAGRIGRAHGLDGSFYVTVPRPRLLDVGMSVTVAARRTTIVRRAGTEEHPIVRLEGIGDRAAVQALRGVVLMVEQLEAPALLEGEWWAHELEGCVVVDGERLIGTVSRLIELPSCEALEVRREMIGSQSTGSHSPAPLLVPMVKDAIRRVAVSEGRIEIDMGFLGETGTGEHGGSGEPDGPEEPGGPATRQGGGL
jgi:16S rRNA processing protein RimM